MGRQMMNKVFDIDDAPTTWMQIPDERRSHSEMNGVRIPTQTA